MNEELKAQIEAIRLMNIEKAEKQIAEKRDKRNESALPQKPEALLKKGEVQTADGTKNIKSKSREVRLILDTESELYKKIQELEQLDSIFKLDRATLTKIVDSFVSDRLRKIKQP